MNRYSKDDIIRLGNGLSTNLTAVNIRLAINNNQIKTKRIVLGQGVRLDHLAYREYGDAGLWWLIAAASGIGWGLQVPAKTMIIIPTNIDILRATY